MRMNWDYIAGLFDGEGSIQIKDYPDRSQGRGISLMIGITDGDALDQLKEFLEKRNIKSSVYHRVVLRGKEKKPIQWWQISNKWDATKFLEAIKNRVIVKRGKVLEALEFRKKLTAFTRPFSELELERIKKLRGSGKTIEQIAEIMGCGRSKAWKATRNER